MFNPFKYDYLGHAIGNAARRKLEKEVKQGAGPVLSAVLPLVAPLVTVQINQAESAMNKALGPTLGAVAVDALEAKIGINR